MIKQLYHFFIWRSHLAESCFIINKTSYQWLSYYPFFYKQSQRSLYECNDKAYFLIGIVLN